MKRHNIPLIMGTVFLIFLLIVVLFPDLFATQSPYTIQHMRFSHSDGQLDIERAPYAPDGQYILGSDHLGRDIYSYIIYGTRLTITLGVLIAISEFLLAVPLALVAGFGNKTVENFIKKFNVLFSAIPALLIAIILLNLDYFKGLEKTQSIIAFVIVLTAVNWARVGVLVYERVESIMVQPFIRGEYAIGKSYYKIALENVIPHLAPELMVLFFMEIARCLSFLMQLGIFAVFIGNLGLINDPAAGVAINIEISYEPEWASMLSTSRTLLTTAPWAIVFPAMAFFISVLGFNLLGEGLRTAVQKKDSQAVLMVRKVMTLDFVYLWKRIKNSRVMYLLLSIVGVIAILSIVSYKDYGVESLEISNLPETAFVGTDGSKEMADRIASSMSALGIEPIKSSGYIFSYEVGQISLIENQSMILTTKDSELQFSANVDFAIAKSSGNLDAVPVYDARKIDLFSMAEMEDFNQKFVMIDRRYYSEMALSAFIDQISQKSSAEGILLVAGPDDHIGNLTVSLGETDELTIIVVSTEVAEVLALDSGNVLKVSSSILPLQSKGYNVIGMLPGSDPYIGDEAIVLGLGYNYLNSSEQDVLRFNLSLMEKICNLKGNKRTIIFAFLDGTLTESQHGIHFLSEDYPYSSQKTQVFIDMTGIKSPIFDSVTFSSEQAPVTRQFSWSLAHHMEKQLLEEKIDIEPVKSTFIEGSFQYSKYPSDNAMFWNRGIPNIILKTSPGSKQFHTLETLGGMVLKAISDNNY